MENTTLLDSALEYVDKGWSIVPLIGKQPPPGFLWGKYRDEDATEADVRNWFNVYGDRLTGVGLITGYAHTICVLDLESDEDPARFDIPETVYARSGGGGWHYYFDIPNMKGAQLPTVDLRKFGITGELRSDGTYTTMPPSIHPNGKKYEWVVPLGSKKLAPIPQWLLDYVDQNTWEPKDWSDAMEGATEGSRHSTTVSVAGKFLYHFPQTEWDTIVLPMLMSWNKQRNDPPLPEKEVMSIYKALARKQSSSGKVDGYTPREKSSSEATQTKRALLTVSSLLSMPESEKPEFLVDMIVPEKGIVALSGHPGCGKSWFMLHMAQCVATGELFLGELKTKKGNVLVVDEESGVWEMKRRIQLLGYPKEMPVYFYSQNGFKVDKQRDLDDLLKVVVEQNIKLVVFDPFVAIHSKVENSAEEAQGIMESLQRFNDVGATVLFIHHHRKGGGGGGQSLRGSSAFSGRLDSHITVEKSNESLTTTSLDIEHVKSRRGKSMPPFRVILTQENTDSPILIAHDQGISAKAIKKEQAKRSIAELLKLGGLTTSEIIGHVQDDEEIGSRNILQALKDMETDKLVRTERDGKKKKYILEGSQAETSNVEDIELVDRFS